MKYILLGKRARKHKGKVTLVDDKDYEYLNQFNWYYQAKDGYAVRNENGKTILMHRAILDVLDGFEIDHIDNDGLNNQSSNLRLATHQQNICNRSKNRFTDSIYKGVQKVGRSKLNTWSSRITYKNRQYFIGVFPTEITAAIAYDMWAKELFGEFASLNF